MRASLYSIATLPEGVNVGECFGDYYVLGKLASGPYVLHAAPGAICLNGMTVLINGAVTAWDWPDVSSLVPAFAAEILSWTLNTWGGDN